MEEREFFNETTEMRTHTLVCPKCGQPGDYKVSWTGTGASAKVTLEKKGIPSVTVPATVVEQKNNHTGISTDSQSGKEVLKSIILSNVSLTL